MNVTNTNPLGMAMVEAEMAASLSNMTIRLVDGGPFGNPNSVPLDFSYPSFTGLSALTGQDLNGPFVTANGTPYGRSDLLTFNNTSGASHAATGIVAYGGNVTAGTLLFSAQFAAPVAIPNAGQLAFTVDVVVPPSVSSQPNPVV